VASHGGRVLLPICPNIKSLDGHIQTAEGTATVPRFEPAAEEIYYLCAPHGLTATHHDQVNADLLAFIKA